MKVLLYYKYEHHPVMKVYESDQATYFERSANYTVDRIYAYIHQQHIAIGHDSVMVDVKSHDEIYDALSEHAKSKLPLWGVARPKVELIWYLPENKQRYFTE